MKLYVTPRSPYAWMAQIVVLEKGLSDQVEVLLAQTRIPDSSYYEINPSGRVPCLILDNGTLFEESALIIEYLDHLDSQPRFSHPDGEKGWESKRLEALASSFLDGTCVWGRELGRQAEHRSPIIIQHEQDRAHRLAKEWDAEIGHPLMNGELNLAQLTLACALNQETQNPDLDWRTGNDELVGWYDGIRGKESFSAVLPVEQVKI